MSEISLSYNKESFDVGKIVLDHHWSQLTI